MGWISPRALARRGILGMNRRNVGYISRYNDRENFPLVDDKLLTKKILKKAGLTAPEMLYTVSTQRDVERVHQQLAEQPTFVIKPAHGSGGKGILVITGKDGDEFVTRSGDRIGMSAVKRHLSNVLSGLYSLGGRTDVAIVEALVVASPIFQKFSYEGVPDIRLIVFKGYPVMGMLRLATEASDGKANLHQGAVGVGLDIGTGNAIAAVQHNEPVTLHPDTGANLMELSVPHWPALLKLAARCYEVTQLGYLGCDIVLDDKRGPMLLELNARPGLSIQIANNQGLLPRLRQIEALDLFLPSVEERVAYAVQEFAVTTTHQRSLKFDEPSESSFDKSGPTGSKQPGATSTKPNVHNQRAAS